MHQPARMDADAEKAKHRLQLARGAVGCERKAPQAGTIPTALQAYDNAAAGRNRVGQHSSHRVFAASVIEYLTEDDLVQYGNKPENGRCAVVYASCQHKRSIFDEAAAEQNNESLGNRAPCDVFDHWSLDV